MLCICCKISSGKSIRSLYASTFSTFCIKVSGWIKYIWLLLSFDVHYFVDVNAPDSHGLVHSAGFPDRWSMANWWWAAEIGVDQGKGACTRTVSSCTAKQCEWVWEQLSRDNQEGFFSPISQEKYQNTYIE